MGVAVLAVSGLMVWGALHIPADAGYAGVGPSFLPWVVALALAICGVQLIWQARMTGYQHMPEPSGAAHGDWPALAWVVAGVLVNASLINTLGFIFSCSLCFVLAVRGLRQGRRQTARRPARGHDRPADRPGHFSAGVLAVYQGAGRQPARAHHHRLALNG